MAGERVEVLEPADQLSLGHIQTVSRLDMGEQIRGRDRSDIARVVEMHHRIDLIERDRIWNRTANEFLEIRDHPVKLERFVCARAFRGKFG